MSKEFDLPVRQEDIDNGVQNSPQKCALALAFRDHYLNEFDCDEARLKVEVGGFTDISIVQENEWGDPEITIDVECEDEALDTFIDNFDKDKKLVEPGEWHFKEKGRLDYREDYDDDVF